MLSEKHNLQYSKLNILVKKQVSPSNSDFLQFNMFSMETLSKLCRLLYYIANNYAKQQLYFNAKSKLTVCYNTKNTSLYIYKKINYLFRRCFFRSHISWILCFINSSVPSKLWETSPNTFLYISTLVLFISNQKYIKYIDFGYTSFYFFLARKNDMKVVQISEYPSLFT